MAKNKKQRDEEEDTRRLKLPRLNLHPETKKSVLGIAFLTLAIVVALSAFGLAGVAGQYIDAGVKSLLGIGFFLVPLTLFVIAFSFFKTIHSTIYFTPLFGGVLFLLSFLGLIDVISRWGAADADAVENYRAGYIGFAVSYPFLYLFGFWVSLLIFAAIVLIAISIAFNIPLFKWKSEEEFEEGEDGEERQSIETIEDLENEDSEFSSQLLKQARGRFSEDDEEENEENDDEQEEERGQTQKQNMKPTSSQKVADFVVETHQKFYKIPPIDLLEKDSMTPNSGDIEAYSIVIQKTLRNFGIDVEMGEVNVGPTVTQYTLKPAQGIKLSRIVALQNDLSLSLAAHPLRIEAPIPGRSLVGIEIPNKVVALVRLRNLIDSPAFTNSPPLTISLGRDVSGNPQYADIEKMPHLLIAGATGSGKSVCIHTILTSLLYKNFPQMVKFLIIDPKRVELAMYSGIPHLLAPIIVDRNKAIAALRWAVKEMERRYEFLSRFKVRNISSYNSQVARKSSAEKVMPYIIIVIDELADLMAASAKEVESSIVRLAQMSRAVGIHLLISTQRPSVEVITGLIKANIPSRIAFQAASLVDSRTILDMSGAEKLVGNGDMLFISQEMSKPRRIQSAFVSEKEVKKITDYIREITENTLLGEESGEAAESIEGELEDKRQSGVIDLGEVNLDDYGEPDGDEELLEQAKEVIARAQKASTSLLQRRLKLGYARAARLMDVLEEQGVIGPQDGAKPREVYIKPEELGNE